MYDEYYKEYCNEVHRIIGSYLFWRKIQNGASTDKLILRGLNESPLSWTLIRHSLQVTMLVTLGRVFDVDGNAFSVDDLLKCCIDEIELFGYETLRQRKIELNDGKEPDYLDDYMSETYVPEVKDFQMLRGEVAKRRKVYETTYRPIRHKIIAHMDKEYLGNSNALWAETNISELEEIIWFLFDLKITLQETHSNGKQLSLNGAQPDTGWYEQDYERLLATISATARET